MYVNMLSLHCINRFLFSTLTVTGFRRSTIDRELVEKGFVIDKDADLILTEKDLFADRLIVRNDSDNERICIQTDEIIVVESFGRDIVIRTPQGSFKTDERLYQQERL